MGPTFLLKFSLGVMDGDLVLSISRFSNWSCRVSMCNRVWQGKCVPKWMLPVQRLNLCMDSTIVRRRFLPAISRFVFMFVSPAAWLEGFQWLSCFVFLPRCKTYLPRWIVLGSNSCRDFSGDAGKDTAAVSRAAWCVSFQRTTWARKVGSSAGA